MNSPTDDDTTHSSEASAESSGAARPERSRHGDLTPLSKLMGPRRVGRAWTVEDRLRVLEDMFFEHDRRLPYLVRFSVLIILSAVIAAFGLLSNSAAVVIGAMLVAPLMTPILATAAALVGGQARRLGESVAILLGGTLAAIGVAWLVALVGSGPVSGTDLTDQLLARTAPGLLDLGIAIAAGAAAAYILTDRGAASALPGVAISVALVPPLATAGIALQLGANSDAEGALLLFSTNLLAIILSAAFVFYVTGFVDREVIGFSTHRVRVGVAVTLVAVVAVSVPLAVHTREIVEEDRFKRAVVDAVPRWDPQAEIVRITTDRDGSRGTIELVVASPTEPVPAWMLAELVAEREALTDVDVKLRHRAEFEDAAQTSR
jgi:uncharacterized hydrophobic protein (TIGR00271 family)